MRLATVPFWMKRWPGPTTPTPASVREHVTRALRFLAAAVDERGLPYIEQGDWCDPMNMVGYKGKGVFRLAGRSVELCHVAVGPRSAPPKATRRPPSG